MLSVRTTLFSPISILHMPIQRYETSVDDISWHRYEIRYLLWKSYSEWTFQSSFRVRLIFGHRSRVRSRGISYIPDAESDEIWNQIAVLSWTWLWRKQNRQNFMDTLDALRCMRGLDHIFRRVFTDSRTVSSRRDGREYRLPDETCGEYSDSAGAVDVHK